MSQGKLCHLCVKISEENRCLYNEGGDQNENYELIMKYFDPKRLFRGKELELTSVCFSCWNQIYCFYNFQESVYEAQKNLLENSKDIHILEIVSPQEGNSNELIENPDINIKTEQEFLSEDEFAVNSENNYEPIEVASESPNKEIYGTSEKNPIHLLPKLEIMDVYSNDDSSEDADDDQDVCCMEETEKDNSLDVAPAIQHAEGVFSRRSWASRKRATKECDDIIAQCKRSFQCYLCSEKCSPYSHFRKHFHDNHPLDKFYITCCERKLYRRDQVVTHMRRHIDPKFFECHICHKQLKGREILNAHVLKYHTKGSESNRKHSYHKKMVAEIDQLMAHADFANQAKLCLECVVCSEKTPTYLLLRQHFESKHPQEKFYLRCCKQKFYQHSILKDHVRLHIDPNAFKCDLCNKKFRESRFLFAHIRSAHNDIDDKERKPSSKNVETDEAKTDKDIDDLLAQWSPTLECVVCKQVCNRFTLLQRHFREIHPQKQFQIKCCQRLIKTRYEIHDHIRFHINPNAFKCDICGMCLRNRRNLHRHMKARHTSTGSE